MRVEFKHNWTFAAFAFVLILAWVLSQDWVKLFGFSTPLSESVFSQQICNITHQPCSVNTPEGVYTAGFDSPIEVEEELLLKFSFPANSEFENGWVEGRNMFMGKTPVIPESREKIGKVTAVVFLGSCNQATMEWRLTARFKDQNGKLVELYYDFVTEI